MKPPKRVGWRELKEDFPNFGSYGKVNYQLPPVYGEMSPIEAMIVAEIAHSLNPTRVLEIGRCRGNSALNLALATEAEITTIDLPVPESIYKDSNSAAAHELWEKYGVQSRIKECLVDSTYFTSENTYQLCLADADHSFEGTFGDMMLAEKYLDKDGVCLIHDYFKRSFPGVTAAVATKAEELDIKWIQSDAEFLNTSLCYFIKK